MQCSQVGLRLLESLFADCLLLEQGILTIHAVLEQLQLRLLFAQFGLQGFVIDLGQQVTFTNESSLLEKDFSYLTRGFESQAHLFVGHHVTAHKEFIGQQHAVQYYSLHIECTALLRSLRLLHHLILQFLIHVRLECT